MAFSETRDLDRINNWVINTSTADLNIHVTTAELENFPNKFDTLYVAGTSHFYQPQAPLMNNPPIKNQSPQLSADGQTNPVSLNLPPTTPPLVNMTATSLTQPNGIEAQLISIALTRNIVHQVQSIVNHAGITPIAQVVPRTPLIALNTNGTLSALPPKTPIVNYTPNLSSWNFSTAQQTALTQKPVTIAAASTITIYMPQRTSKILLVRLTAKKNASLFQTRVTFFARYTV